MRRGLELAAAVGTAPALTASSSPATHASSPCPGEPVKVFDNTNTGGVLNGGERPTSSTYGKSYGLTSIVTYHSSNGHGAKPILGIGATPSWGKHRLTVRFSLTTSIQYTAPRGGLEIGVG